MFLTGKELNLIRANAGLVAGQSKTYDLWITGGVMSITDANDVKDIDRWLKESEKMGINPTEYVKFMIMENW
jgi:hypothetical protein